MEIAKKVLIAPSILAADFGRLNEEIASIEQFADLLHVDLMDHHFVPNLTFGAPVIRCIKTKLPMDCHLMVENPEQYLEELGEIGVSSVTVHAESTKHLHSVLQKIKELGMKPAVAINPGTSIEMISEVLPMVEMVLVMSVNPGFGGQKFLDLALDKIKKLRKEYPKLLIQADGGINAETARLCREAGADVLVAGSYIFKAENKKAAIESLRD
ncbi:MAG: ribulose-phosphate 3-epimerase [Candidatus Altimarinota bacterium]